LIETKESTIKTLILDAVFPRKCLGCDILLDLDNSFSNRSLLCTNCGITFNFNKELSCAFCSSKVLDGKTCAFCIPDNNLDQLFVTTSYENELVKKVLKTMKYKFVAPLAHDVGTIMKEYLVSLGDKIDPHSIIVPIPLHRLRHNWRGFNQSRVIGENIAHHTSMSFFPDTLRRKVKKAPQVDIDDKQARIENIRDQFEYNLSSDFENDTILLIDDVSTTGSTLNEAARILKQHGASRVVGLVFARG